MKQKLPLFLHLFFMFSFFVAEIHAQVKYPISITNFNVTPSVFLSDYTTPGEGNIKATLRLNDHNEPDLNVYLKLTIESMSVKLTTSPSFRPSEAIMLIPEVPYSLSDIDFAPYFQFQNIVAQGISQMELQRTDQLPEGWYTFTLQVMDLLSGKALSQPMSIKANVMQIDPPTLVTPSKGELISVKQSQITFQWQQNAHASLRNLQTAYYLRLYEIPETEQNPLLAIQNGAREVFISDPIYTKVYNYSAIDVPLDPGKRYAYTVTIQELNGRNWFKNNGVSEIGWFYYGYPTGGKISLRYPNDGDALDRNMMQRLEWNANDNLIDGTQPVIYSVKVVKIGDYDDPETAIDYSDTKVIKTGVILNKSGYSVPLGNVGSEERYAWQVTAYTEDVEVGKSPVYTFYSPPIIDNFIAGYGHIIEVTKITNAEYNDFSGKGKVQINKKGDKIEVHYEHLKIQNIDGLFLMVGGEIKCNVNGMIDPITVYPNEDINDKAVFYPDSIRIRESDGMYLKGRVEWDLPFGTTEKQKSKVKFKQTWFDFNSNYRLIGSPEVDNKQGYNLLEPSNFRIELDNNSLFRIYENNWDMIFSGQLWVHENIKGSAKEKYSIIFKDLAQLHYNEIRDYREKNEIHLIANTKLYLAPRTLVVDLSEEQSPQKFSDQPDWKGIYFLNFDLHFDPSIDDNGQIKLTQEIFDNYTTTSTDTCKSWITGDGLHFLYGTKVAEDGIVQFNTFPSRVDLLNLKIEKSNLAYAQLKGSIQIPVINQNDRYSYTVPITKTGFQTGYLDKSLEGLGFVFNESSKEQKLQAKIKRAVFANQDHLDMDLELSWSEINAVFTDLQQFNVWGNYEIGFINPKGVINLTNQVQGTVENYAINIEQIGCGRMCNQYSFAISASIVIDQDISGPKGAPKLNIYSIANNKLLKGDCDLPEQDIQTTQIFANDGGRELTDEGVGESGDENNFSKEAQDARLAELSVQMNELNNTTTRLSRYAGQIAYDTVPVGSLLVSKTDGYTPDNITVEMDIQDVITLLTASKFFVKEENHPKIDAWIKSLQSFDSGIAEFNDLVASVRNGDLLKMIIDMGVDALMPIIAGPIENANNTAKKQIADFINSSCKKEVLAQLDKLTETTGNQFKTIAMQGIASMNDARAKAEVEKAINSGIETLKKDIKKAVDKSIDENFTGYFTRFLDTIVYARALAFVDSTIRSTLKDVVTGHAKEVSTNEIKDNCSAMLNAMAQDAKNLVDPKNIANMLENTGKGVLNNFEWEKLILGITGAYLAGTFGDEVSRLLPDEVKNLYNNPAISGIANNITNNVNIDFNSLKNGNFKDAMKFDPTAIKITSKVVDAEGYAERIKDDPIYGDVFKAGINATIKVPVSFNAYASFVTGKKTDENFDYWYVDFGARKLGLSMAPVPLVFDGGTGRVFKHMSRTTSSSQYIPDKSNEFGAGVQAFFYDQTGGGIAVFDVDFEMNILNEGFKLTMSGNALLGNNIDYTGKNEAAPEPEKGGFDSVPMQVPVSKSLAIGYGEMGYSSIEKTFYAMANVKLGTSPILCGEGEFNARISPGDWSLSIGTRENPITAKLLCLNNISISSWLSVNKSMLDVGIAQNIDLSLRTPWLDLGVLELRAYAEFLFNYGGSAIIYWKPLKLKEASFYTNVRLAVGVEYDTFLKSGKLDLAAIGFGGELTYLTRTREELMEEKGTEKQVTNYIGDSYASLYGRLYGYVTVIGIKVGVDFDAKKEWKN